MTNYRSIWGEREIVLSELDPSIHRNFVSRNWVSLCEVSNPPPTALIRELYSFKIGDFLKFLISLVNFQDCDKIELF